MNLSFCIIVKNEEAALPQCLASVRDVVDEMVVLDTGSTDNTIAIAQSFNAHVYSFEWCNDFSAARNESLKYVQGDWVLVLDADEVLVPEIIPELRQAICSPHHLLVNLVRQEVGAAQSPYSLVSRLFRRHRDIHFTRPYHAMVDDSVEAIVRHEPGWQIGYLPDVAILHYGYQASAIAARDKFAKARTIMEGFLANHPTDPYVCSKLGALYVEMGAKTRGLRLLEWGLQSIQNQSQIEAPILYELHYHLGCVYGEQNSLQAEQHYQLAVQQSILPKLKLGAINNWGNLLKEKGDLVGAKALYEQALEIDPALAIAHNNLGITLKALGQFGDAIAHYQTAIDLQPNYAEAHQNLGVVFLKVGRVSESLAAFGQAIALHEQTGSSEGDRLRKGLREMGFEL
ncbi:tetratricopeptide repeat protein [Phormidesmis priestleyi ULC007]|uniref:Tetratricopeptide repeat protein n=1 Tax=Phormidesmis priestleyi ULC007 TaxID=1920490 RepID=A0A2T1DG49_9CYAN|nr:glycosyltransferase [Phormidesmis priestleyi]PSB19456.1 tetratricopeptide repeat protein [Phormidesmis priestleyi ULC007]PZO53104.1 MAG: tetratricopeptide repeat protein [Phormidesmis priestleyi]